MKLLQIHKDDDPILKMQAHVVKDFNEDLVNFAKDMFYTMKIMNGIGLAATQVGSFLRIITVDTTAAGGNLLAIMINPVILQSNGEIKINEGCLSFVGETIHTKRSHQVTVQYQDFHKNYFTRHLSGIDAVVCQHECDHLDGITFHERKCDE